MPSSRRFGRRSLSCISLGRFAVLLIEKIVPPRGAMRSTVFHPAHPRAVKKSSAIETLIG